jgi:gliding motility-associated protein GldM
MAHGKETPRQKMIGMMYLVLTAMLALNVQKEVLNAFVTVDEGLVKTVENFAKKNEIVYADFKQAAAENSAKAGKWKDKADEVKKQADALYNYIQDLKIEIVNISEGKENEAINGKIVTLSKVEGKEKMDVPAQVMVGSANNGKANDLKRMIEKFRNDLLAMVDPSAVDVIESIKKNLDTTDPPAKEGKTETWQSEHFEQLPLVGVMTIMSGLQANVRNAETDILRYLYTMIDAGSFKFNSLEATIIPNSNYIIQGNTYEAKVFIAASDTTQDPIVYVGAYDSTRLEDGTYKYEIKPGYQELPVKNGKGVYSVKGGKVGYTKWGGLIRLKSPSGGADILKPFKAQFQVSEPLLVVSPTKLNLFYIGVDNPVEISVPGVPGDKIFPSIDNGTIRKDGKGYIVNPSRAGKGANVSVIVEIDKVKKSMGSRPFRVRTVPDPIAKVGGIKGSGSINKQLLLAQAGVIAEMENFEFDLTFKVTSFTVSTNQGGFTIEKDSKSNRFTEEQLGIIGKSTRGQKIYIENVKAVGPDGTTRQLGAVVLTLK